jgi:hypothetical protein
MLFKGAMVRALLAGTKSQTRRLVKRQALEWLSRESSFSPEFVATPENYLCPYGYAGDRIWVKETSVDVESHGWLGPVYLESAEGTQAREWGWGDSTDPDHIEAQDIKCRPSLFMTRAMSRIDLELVAVRIERLQDISDLDALAEGIVFNRERQGYCIDDCTHFHSFSPRASYFSLWESINGPGSVELNPWVWVLSFRRRTKDAT